MKKTLPRSAHRLAPAGRRAVRPLVLACWLAAAGAGVPAAAQAQALSASATAISVDLAAQPLEAAVNALARQAGVAISADARLLAGKQAPAVRGRFTLAEALRQLLAGSGLVAAEQGEAVILRGAGAATLGEVTVTAHASTAEELPAPASGGQVARGARLGMLGNVDIMDAPFNVTAYTSQVIQDQQATTVADVLRNDPSVRYTTSDGHNAENFSIRGFEVNSSDLAFNGMYGLLPKTHVPTELIERVEVFKGPAAMLSGVSPTGGVGGVISIVPKRAGDQPLTQLTTTYTSKSRLGLSADVGRRFGPEQRLGIRFNGAYSNGKTTLDGQKKRENFASLALDYRGDDWSLALDAYATKQNQANGSPLMVSLNNLTRAIKAPHGDVNALKGTYADQDSEGAVLRGEYRFNNQWSAYAAVGGARYHYEGYLNGTRVIVRRTDGTATAATYHQKGYTDSVSAETGVRGALRTGSVGHQLVASASVLQTRSGLSYVGNSTSASYTTNIYSPITPLLGGQPSAVNKTSDSEFLGLALSDTLSMVDDKVLLTLGVRHQTVRVKSWNARTLALSGDYDKSALTPAVGLVVKPWGDGISLYGNYIEALTPGDIAGATYANAGETLAPYKSKQGEVGVKWEYGGFTNTFDVFQITKASSVANAANYLVADGEQRHRGVEWNTFGEVAPGVRLLGGLAYIRAEMTEVAATSANKGKTPYGVPKWTANLGAEWDTPWVPGLTLSGRVIYTGAQYANSSNVVQLPSWTRLDVGARYTLRVSGKPVTLRASVDNLTNRAYWSGTFNDGFATIGAARTYKLSATVNF